MLNSINWVNRWITGSWLKQSLRKSRTKYSQKDLWIGYPNAIAGIQRESQKKPNTAVIVTVAKLLHHVPVYHYLPFLSLPQIGIIKRFYIPWRGSEGVLVLLYSRRPHVVACSSLGASTLATAVATGEEADDDTAEADNGADDGLEDAADTADNSHDCISNGLEARSNTRHNTAHFG
jgi:hypothetical protein